MADKQHLAAIRMLFDWLVTGQVVAKRAQPTAGENRRKVDE
jgi:hypothetical protein